MATHEPPYPSSADRFISFQEMTYHLGLIRTELAGIRKSIEANSRDRKAALRWRVGLVVSAVFSTAAFVMQIVTG